MERYHISGVPITEDGRLVGILTNRDLRFVEASTSRSDVMTRRACHRPGGDDARGAQGDPRPPPDREAPDGRLDGRFSGLITVKDI